jgi:hypothetical protein
MLLAACPALALDKVGAIDPFNGYPLYYQDDNGLQLELCLEPGGLCIMDELTTPVFPTNWAIEHFWYFAALDMNQATNAVGQPVDLDSFGNKRRLFEFAVEASFANEAVIDGDQIAFTRLRIRFDNLVTGADYTFTHPYGSVTLTAVDDPGNPGFGEINFTNDVGIQAGVFDGALNGAITTNFLSWDGTAPAPPAGFIGDPAVPHTVTGGTNTAPVLSGNPNKVVITGPSIGGSPFNQIESEMWAISGKVATRFGATTNRATYSRKAGGNGRVDVFAESNTGQLLTATTDAQHTMAEGGSTGSYLARVPFSSATFPTHVTVANRSDAPDSVYDPIPLSDVVTIERAEFTITGADGSGVLNVKAESSDKSATAAPTLMVYDNLGNLIGAMTNGVLANQAMTVVPSAIEVRSSMNGTQTVPVTLVGPAVN